MTLYIPPHTLMEQSETALHLTLVVDANTPYLEGHFTNTPILAGVVQVGWVIQLAQTYFKTSPTITSMTNLKFNSPITSDDTLNIEITHLIEKQQLSFKISSQNGPCSSGRITLSQ